MGYIGNQTTNSYTSLDKQTITGNGGASYTLDHAVANENELEVFVNNVRQEPSVAYTVSNTTLTMTGDVQASDDFYVVFQGKAIQTTSHPEGQDLQARDGTFSGNLTVDTDTLHVDATNNRVGIGTSSPASELHLHVSGASNGSQIRFDSDYGIGYVGQENNASNNLILGSSTAGVTFYAANTERMRIDSSGHVMIGKTTNVADTDGFVFREYGQALIHRDAGYPLLVGTSGSGILVQWRSSGSQVGYISTNGSSTTYSTSSDHRLKENAVDLTGAITRVKSLQPKRFNFIADDSTTVDGFMAHEAATVVPEAVTGTHNEVDADGNPVYQGIDQAKLVPLLTAALQEAIAKIETLETKVTALENA